MPAWLMPEHDAWLDTMIEALAQCQGVTCAEADTRGDALGWAAHKVGLSSTTVAGIWCVLRGFTRTAVDARVVPRELRAEIFPLAAATSPADALARTCEKHGVSAEQIKSWLYADVPSARVVRIEELPSAQQLRDAYNVALAQGLLSTCVKVTVASDDLRAIVRAAKLRGLLVSIDAEGPTLRASGPLALFRQTRKYAHALAAFLPALTTGTRFSLDGELDDGGTLHLDEASPLPREWPEPMRVESALERALTRALAQTGWTLRREPVVLHAKGELFYPDFVLERGGDRVVVEVVGFWTPDYLERKMAHLATVTDAPMIVCLDETLACDPSRLPDTDVLRFRRKLDPVALLEAAERAIRAKASPP